jgi:hypothetical protein
LRRLRDLLDTDIVLEVVGSQTAATGVVLVDAELAGFAQRSLAKFQGLESRFTGAKGGGRPSRTAGRPICITRPDLAAVCQ